MKFVPFLCAALLCACTTSNMTNQQNTIANQQNMPSVPLAGKWQLAEFTGFSAQQIQQAKAYMDLSEMPKAHANMGCNQLMFQVKTIDATKIQFDNMASTRMACGDEMKLEQAFSQASRQGVWTYSLQNNRLILRHATGVEMQFTP